MGVTGMIPHCIIVRQHLTPHALKELPGRGERKKPNNVIMANWSKEMWQNVLNRAVRMLAAGPFAPHFSSATETVN
ncbi:hypothetical protein KIN20_023097 [Parelaphostrongylus tenuis]|uniref:Uncharacterized protein n=1 Tax=Parelaphostrongylus tenuis TaxID=148309 RepID=A0AAD5NBZ6_PARTN|nr:hypothetical protein KIN20_023097 [Parelaphostrongylus tenuis]